jgi:DNA-binding NarL/FixJ family response regulator
MIRVLVADDHPVVRSGIRNILNGNKDIEVVGEVVNGDQVLSQVQILRPDVLVLDFQMPGLRAPDLVRYLKLGPEPPRVLVLTAYGNVEYVLGMLCAGAEVIY